jgi:CHAD domain-containing protein
MASKTIARERELKLAPGLDFELPDLRPTVGRAVQLGQQRLRTAYFDTSDFRLWQRGVTLRHRTGDRRGPGTWTVKLPEGGDKALDRTELSWAGQRKAVPDAAQTMLRGIIRRSQLQQVADLATTRRRLSLRDQNGRSWAELDDDIVTIVKGGKNGGRFRELELELSPGRDGPVDDVLKKLYDAGARPESVPKLAKAVAVLSGAAPRRPPQQLNSHARVGDVARACIADGLDRLLDHDYRLRLQPEHPPAHDVHQARVATRRLRSDLKTFRSLLVPDWVGYVRDELRWVGNALGRVRDSDVLINTLTKDGTARPPGQRSIRRRLVDQRRKASQDLAEVLESSRYLDLLDTLRAAADVPPFRGDPSPLRLADGALPGLIEPQWRSLRRRVHQAGRHPSDSELHRIRIAAKQLRYAAEAATPVVGKPAKKMAKAAENLQTVLGDHHDAVAAGQWLDRDTQGRSATEAAQHRELIAEQHQRRSDLRQKWPSAWAKVADKKTREWLR